MILDYKIHTKENMIPFKEGITVNTLLDFYNNASFKSGGPVYPYFFEGTADSEDLEDSGVMILCIPNSVRSHLKSEKWKKRKDLLYRFPVATDALVTLAGIDGLGKVSEDEFMRAATRKTIGNTNDNCYISCVFDYLVRFPALEMTQSCEYPIKVSSCRPNKEVLKEYKVIGVVPAPLMDLEGNLEKNILSLNIPHMFEARLGLPPDLLHEASPKSVRMLYEKFSL